jgi:glutathione-regulated potassium-efflux system ancillary protein KefF
MILVIHAHPYPQHSRAGKALLNAAKTVPGVVVHSLYERYPDFDIDVAAEQAALTQAKLVVWLHPVYWYSAPALLKQWFEVVLLRGWAYGGQGAEGNALHGKACLWAATIGGPQDMYTAEGAHQRPFADFAAPIEQTAKFCGMTWLPPVLLHGAHVVDEAALHVVAEAFKARLMPYATPSTITEGA